MNSLCNFSSLPEELSYTIFSNIPRETATVLPYICKSFLALANKNELWDNIATKYKVKNLKLDFNYNKNEAKFSFLMRNKEIANMFMCRKYCGDNDLEIDLYNPIDKSAIERINQRLNMGQTAFCTVFSKNSSQLKNINFMLDLCQNPGINGYIIPFLENKDAIYVVMAKCRQILEIKYKVQKNFLQIIELNRHQKKIPNNLRINPLEERAREITQAYENAIKIFNLKNKKFKQSI